MQMINKKITAILFALLALSTTAATTATAQDNERRDRDLPPDATLNDVVFGGTSCSDGGSTSYLVRDGEGVVLRVDGLAARVGENVSRRESRKNCNVILEVGHTPGWQYSVDSIRAVGFAVADDDIRGMIKMSYHFQGQRATVDGVREFEGPIRRRLYIHEDFSESVDAWSPCGANRALVLRMQSRLNNRRNRDGFGLSGLSGRRGMYLELKWRRCE